jgi:hypothetical protein
VSRAIGAAGFRPTDAMRSGYLAIETHTERPGLVRFVLCDELPDPDPTGHGERRWRYIAGFNDIEAALMHTHDLLKRRLLDPDTHMYRASPERAIAAVESLGLKHRRIYLDANFDAQSQASIRALTEKYVGLRRAWATFFQTLGYIGIGLLLLNLFTFSIR